MDVIRMIIEATASLIMSTFLVYVFARIASVAVFRSYHEAARIYDHNITKGA